MAPFLPQLLLLLFISQHGRTMVRAYLKRHLVSHLQPSRQRSKINMSLKEDSELKGFEAFVRTNPLSDKISATKFHHVEFYCGDAVTTHKRFMLGLGLDLVAKSDLATGNTCHASYVLQSGDLRMVFTAPYGIQTNSTENINVVIPGFDKQNSLEFFNKHGLGVRAVAIEVENVYESYSALVSNGGIGNVPPTRLTDASNRGHCDIAEVSLYGDVMLRLMHTSAFSGSFLPNFVDVEMPRQGNIIAQMVAPGTLSSPLTGSFGIQRFDHIVGNLWSLIPKLKQLKDMTGFHEFAEFVAEDVGTLDSGLNSVVIANNNEMVLLPLNEPTFGTRRKSQIQTYLEQNNGEGVQHMALLTSDIISTLRCMRAAGKIGGFEFLDTQSASYYDARRELIGDALTDEQYASIRELGVLVDRDDQGVLLQIFTKPVGDRPTLFLEIIQRIGCMDASNVQRPGCGGFGKGNFKDLFKSIEDFEKQLNI